RGRPRRVIRPDGFLRQKHSTIGKNREEGMRRLRFILMLLAVALPVGARAEYPERPIRFIVPQAAGSATDTVARLVAAELGPILGTTVAVDDRPGAALTLGLDLVAKSNPDGYTI